MLETDKIEDVQFFSGHSQITELTAILCPCRFILQTKQNQAKPSVYNKM